MIASCVADKVAGDRSVLVPWWSIAKTAIAACALVLVAGGRLDLDRPMPGRRFTLRQLLQHTSGLTCYTESDAVRSRRSNGTTIPWSEDDLLAHIDAATLLFEPGQGWSYSNSGYFLVRRLIEQTTGIRHRTRRSTRWCWGRSEFQNSFIARTRADLRRSVWGDEDDFHPGWVSHGLLMGPAGGCGAVHAPAIHRRAAAAAAARRRCACVIRSRSSCRTGRGGRRAMASG